MRLQPFSRWFDPVRQKNFFQAGSKRIRNQSSRLPLSHVAITEPGFSRDFSGRFPPAENLRALNLGDVAPLETRRRSAITNARQRATV